MIQKEVAELRRRYKLDKNTISRVRGCFVNESREIVTEFNQSFTSMSSDEVEEILALMKKTLSGTVGKNLVDIELSREQVTGGDEHATLMALKNSALDDDESVTRLLQSVAQSADVEGSFMILLTCDRYDVFSYSGDGERSEESSELFTYVLCAVCPIKPTKQQLSFHLYENRFSSIAADIYIAPPELGFMFPSFDDRASNIYNAVCYTKNTANDHRDFIESVFCSEVTMPAAVQKQVFRDILSEAVSEDCSYDVASTLRDELCVMIEEHKQSNDEQPLLVSKNTVKSVLKSCGVSEPKVQAFEQRYDSAFGADTELPPQNIVDTNRFEVVTPDVSIKVRPERSDLLQTRVIDGTRYILIRANEDVEVNGVSIHIQ